MALDSHAESNGMVCEKGGDGGVNRPLVIVAPPDVSIEKGTPVPTGMQQLWVSRFANDHLYISDNEAG